MTRLVLPQAASHALLHPVPEAASFTPTRFTPASTKAWFAGHMLRFLSSDFPKHQFTQRFYNQLMHCFGMCAHYDREGFWTEYFTSTRNKVEFLIEVSQHPCYGSPEHTFSDVEREVIRRVNRSSLLAFYIQHLTGKRDAAERAEYARLQAKFGGISAPEPARTVFVPVPQPPPPRTKRREGSGAQLALGLIPAAAVP